MRTCQCVTAFRVLVKNQDEVGRLGPRETVIDTQLLVCIRQREARFPSLMTVEAVDVHLGTVQSKIYANLNFGNLAVVSIGASSIDWQKKVFGSTNNSRAHATRCKDDTVDTSKI